MWLNVDLGELPDEPDELYALTDLANIACGGHAGDEASMRRALAACARHGALPIAHPSFVDREHFGRRALEVDAAQLREQLHEQCASLVRLAQAPGLHVKGVKAHGALYHAVDRDPALAQALVDAAHAALGPHCFFIGPAGGALAATGMPLAVEGFADRARRRAADGRWQLVPRGEPGALLEDVEAAAELTRTLIAEGEVATICVHGDGPQALPIARAVRAVLGPRG
jgi:UPF0271 protein